jgi:hypothetical protein
VENILQMRSLRSCTFQRFYCSYSSEVAKIIIDINCKVAKAVPVQSVVIGVKDTVGEYECFGVNLTLTLKTEAICSFETLISTYNTTRCHKPQATHIMENQTPWASKLYSFAFQSIALCRILNTLCLIEQC